LKTTAFACILFAFASYFLPARAQVLENAEDAFRISAENNTPILLIFSGSDWCAPCIKFEKRILSDALFQDFAKQNLVMLNADFPQRKPMSASLQKQNDALAEKYNPNGLFPHLVLIYPRTRNSMVLSYSNQGSTEFISELRMQINYEQHTGSK
jgi:thiamine biosynthesis lipoprotein